MGVAYSAERQKHLENAFQILCDNHKHAITVMLDYGQDCTHY